MADFMMNAIIGVASAIVIGAIAVMWTATGPNCPGMDPGYIGWCTQQMAVME